MIRSRIKLFFQKIRIKKELKKLNLELKNTHEGQRCFILGTGPSIKDQDLTLLRNEWTFATAGLYLHPKYDFIHPKFYAIIDFTNFNEDEESKKYLEGISRKMHDDTTIILPLPFREKVIEKRNLFPKNKKIYIAQDKSFQDDLNFNVDITKEVPCVPNVIHVPMILANYLGFKTIYLMGVEHNWLAKRSCTPEVPYFQDEHFYEEKDFPKIPILTKFVPYEKICESSGLAFRAHRLLKEKMTGVKIFNLTPGSYLDVFPFRKYEDIMKK